LARSVAQSPPPPPGCAGNSLIFYGLRGKVLSHLFSFQEFKYQILEIKELAGTLEHVFRPICQLAKNLSRNPS
jgi:hypothetical protein